MINHDRAILAAVRSLVKELKETCVKDPGYVSREFSIQAVITPKKIEITTYGLKRRHTAVIERKDNV